MKYYCFLLISILISCATRKSPEIIKDKDIPEVMVLGVFHFEDQGLDSYQPKYSVDILSDERQKELEELINRLAAFRPTKIIIEWNRIKDDSSTNASYRNYLDGKLDISQKKNEVYQLGFKLAKKLGHQRIYCGDANTEWCGVEMEWEHFDENEYLKSHGQYDKSTRHNYEAFYAELDSLKSGSSLKEHLAYLNDPAIRLKGHQAYLSQISILGAGDHYVGADFASNWYRRNIRIFSNVYDLAEMHKEERILLIYGAGHAWILNQLFSESPDFRLVKAHEFLQK